MTQSTELLSALKRLMKAKGLTYAHAAELLSLSESSVKRLFSEQDFTLERLSILCDTLETNFLELARLANLENLQKPSTLSWEQEEELALNPHLFQIFYLLLRAWKIEDMHKRSKLSPQDLEKTLLRLDKLGLIELHPGNKVKLLTAQNLRWLKGGPIEQAFAQEVKARFLSQSFDKPDEKFCVLSGALRSESLVQIKTKMERLEREIEELILSDSLRDKDTTKPTVFLLAQGPFMLSIFEGDQA